MKKFLSVLIALCALTLSGQAAFMSFDMSQSTSVYIDSADPFRFPVIIGDEAYVLCGSRLCRLRLSGETVDVYDAKALFRVKTCGFWRSQPMTERCTPLK